MFKMLSRVPTFLRPSILDLQFAEADWILLQNAKFNNNCNDNSSINKSKNNNNHNNHRNKQVNTNMKLTKNNSIPLFLQWILFPFYKSNRIAPEI